MACGGAKMKTKSKVDRLTAWISSSNDGKSLPNPAHKKSENKSHSNSGRIDTLNPSWRIGGHLHRWDVETGVTPDLLFETGVSFLESDTEEDSNGPSPAKCKRLKPPNKQIDKKPVSKLAHPRRTDVSDRISVNNEPYVMAQDLVLFGRPRTPSCDNFQKLSDEIILYIFKMLNKQQLARCIGTCKRWKRLAGDESLWKQLDLSRRTLSGNVLGRVLDRGAVALRLSLCQVQGTVFPEAVCDNRILPQPNCLTSKLQFLDLSMANISVDTLEELLSFCVHLRKLSLEHITLNDRICRSIASNPDLEVLNMCMCSGMNQEGLAKIAINCQKLQSWNLAWSHLSTAALDLLFVNIPSSLRRLNISGCKESLNEDHLASLVRNCPMLVELDISNSSNITSSAIPVIVVGFPLLQHLHASHCYSIAPAQFVSLGKLRHLRNLEVFGILMEAALAALRHSLPGVEINRHIFSTVARPTTGIRRTSIWGIRLQ